MASHTDNSLVPLKPAGNAVTGMADLLKDRTFFSKLPSPAILERDSYSANALADVLNRATHASFAKLTRGLSPTSLTAAYFDWLVHLLCAPGKQLQLTDKALRKLLRLQLFLVASAASEGEAEPCIEPLPQDKRFKADGWQRWPFNLFYQSHLLAQQWWHVATTGVPGVSSHHQRVLEFTGRQILDIFAPSNFVLTNPEILEKTRAEHGMNLLNGFRNFLEDLQNEIARKPPAGAEKFRPGIEVAATPGKVVFRNRLIELIQYSPTTETVHPEPILIVPAWINKYYILDLSPENSMIRYLVGQGHTVFAISWKNPEPGDRDLGMDDYGNLGIIAALNAIGAIVPGREIHGVGYCLGGTLLAIAASALARNSRQPFKSLSFFAAQVDFDEPGELQLFIDESQVQFLEDMMWEQGFLDAKQMSGAFQLLHSNDLFWSSNMHKYLMGERPPLTDLMAWNADSTRMPYRMHSEYLRSLYLNNDLAEGRFEVDGQPVTIGDLRVPLFCVGTERDHVAPWHSVYKWNRMTDTEITFVLTSGGHNGGIVSEPGHPHRHYRIATRQHDDLHIDPETWAAETPVRDGSWWTAWTAWLDARSGARTAPPPMGNPEAGYAPLADAPGSYVLMK